MQTLRIIPKTPLLNNCNLHTIYYVFRSPRTPRVILQPDVATVFVNGDYVLKVVAIGLPNVPSEVKGRTAKVSVLPGGNSDLGMSSVVMPPFGSCPIPMLHPAAVKRHVCAALHRIRPANRVGVVVVEAPTVRQLRRLERLARREHKRRTRGKANYGPFHGIIQPHFSSRDTKTGLWSDVSRSVVTWDSLTETLPAWAVSTAI